MKLQNTTDISEGRIREMIEFVKPNNLPTSKYTVKVTNASVGYTGTIYYDGYNSDRPKIIVRVTKKESEFPHLEDHSPTKCIKEKFQKFNEKKGIYESWIRKKYLPNPGGSTGGYIDALILSREEAFVHVLAHELRHLWQKNHLGKRGKVWGARGTYSDRDADAYAIKMTRKWRKKYNPCEIYPDDCQMYHINADPENEESKKSTDCVSFPRPAQPLDCGVNQ